ncbi:hypothetical protein EYF80_032856 [Liparis tanakae]|uniref:Uncharacterized protein n=1 Tax=Liparis tanakae TaxID=230148 RepID=A0A4Z2GTJ1_9TELE|nr:hypothetical protein EYF80_032856 [Liparis tanakae]
MTLENGGGGQRREEMKMMEKSEDYNNREGRRRKSEVGGGLKEKINRKSGFEEESIGGVEVREERGKVEEGGKKLLDLCLPSALRSVFIKTSRPTSYTMQLQRRAKRHQRLQCYLRRTALSLLQTPVSANPLPTSPRSSGPSTHQRRGEEIKDYSTFSPASPAPAYRENPGGSLTHLGRAAGYGGMEGGTAAGRESLGCQRAHLPLVPEEMPGMQTHAAKGADSMGTMIDEASLIAENIRRYPPEGLDS